MAFNHDPQFQNVTCNKCGTQAHSKAHTQHRRCSGQQGAKPRDKTSKKLASSVRGMWMS